MNPIICLGEALVDMFADDGVAELPEATRFSRAQGGAVANVAVGLARLGAPARFAGAVGRDPFGRFLIAALARDRVDVDLVRVVPEHTALAFVARKPGGDRDFVFYRDPGADSRYVADDMPPEALAGAGVLHFGGVSLSREPARGACLAVAASARERGLLVTIDVNVRATLFEDHAHMRDLMLQACALADIVKCSDDDARALQVDLDQPLPALSSVNTKALVITRGERGATWFAGGERGDVAPPKVKAVDTTGAGDAFMAALIWRLRHSDDAVIDAAAVADAVRYGCAAGAIATQSEGATSSLPERAELERVVRSMAADAIQG